MDLTNLQKTWNSLAENDALWAVLSWEDKKDGKWNPEEFFEVGRGEVRYILSEVEKRQPLPSRQNALDFGCGVGRLTLALGEHFDHVHGVDIAPRMIAAAEQFKQGTSASNCTFHLNQQDDLRLFEDDSFDFVLTVIVLQHMEPRFTMNYIREFIRVLKPDGICVFQLPDETENRAGYTEFDDATEPVMEMYGVASEKVTAFLQKQGAEVLDVVEDQSCGPDLRSLRYFVTKPAR